jgi:hypothetical protein
VNTILRSLETAFGFLIWGAVLWDSFATVVLPRTVAPMRRLSGRFNKLSWTAWAAIGRRIAQRDLQLSFLAIYGPISVVMLLVLWAGLMILAFALIYQGLGTRFQAESGETTFGTLLYTSGSTFLTLGIGDVTTTDPLGRLLMIVEAASGFTFLGLVISYMPVLEQAYGTRETGSLLIHSRVGTPPSAFQYLRRYSSPDRLEVLRGNLRDGERWMAGILESHLSHPVLSFYRAQHFGESWLVALTTLLDCCALLIVGGRGVAAEQAKLTYVMGVQLLKDLVRAVGITADVEAGMRLPETDLPAVLAAAEKAKVTLTLDPRSTQELLRLVRQYDVHLAALSDWLVIPLPPFIPPFGEGFDSASERSTESTS